MTRDDVIAILRTEESRLRADYGVETLALFGSFARDRAGPGSDVDLLVEFERPVGLFHLFRTQEYLERIFGRGVDLATPDGLIDELKPSIYGDAIYVLGPRVEVPHHAHPGGDCQDPALHVRSGRGGVPG